MAVRNNKSPMYFVNFENYLKPQVKSYLIEEKKSIDANPEKNSTFQLFCKLSSIHGISMLCLDKRASLCERVSWKIIICTSIITTFSVLYYWTMINHATPTVTYIETTHYPGYVVPFPAITLCSLNRISKEKAFHFADKLTRRSNLTKAKILELFQVPLYINENIKSKKEDNKLLDDLLAANNFTLLDFFLHTNNDCMKELKRCMWKGRIVQCATVFEPVVILRGRCCTFNYFAPEENQTTRYNSLLIQSTHPRRVSGCGPENGLTVLIDPKVDDYSAGALKFPAYRIIVADSYDFPEDNGNEIIPIKQEAFVAIKTAMTFGTTYLRNMALLKRGCIFDEEYKLSQFRQYSMWNCLAECLNARFLRRCGCIPHNTFLPKGTRMCSLNKFNCILQEREVFRKLVEDSDILGTNICNCMAECTYFKYRTVVATGQLNRTFTKGHHRFFKNLTTTTDEILLHIFFGDLNTEKYRIDAIESWQSIVGTVGGIAGMTMGINVVCIAEVFFFLCIRPLYQNCFKGNRVN